MNPDLQKERNKCTFRVETVTNMFDGGAEETARRRYLQSVIERDPTGIFSNDDSIHLHRTDRHVRALAKHVRLVEICRALGIGEEHAGEMILSRDFQTLVQSVADDLPTSLHWVMFVPNIMSLFDDEQQRRILPLCRDWRIVGCYAQTELGHGSNVRALETTATYQRDDADGHFVVNSPTLTSTKFWPGTLGRTANYAVVIARLVDGDGVDRGVHNFLVPLRDTKTHRLLPGVTTGDLGPKLGYNSMDNGYCQFHQVKIPRRNMAMRFAAVDKAGKYRKLASSSASQKVAYITMMQVRAYICDQSSKALAAACTIAIRYSAVRRQGYDMDKEMKGSTGGSSEQQEEVPVLDYKQQQHRLLPLLAASYLFHFSGRRMLARLKDVERKLLLSKDKANNNNKAGSSAVVTREETTDIHASSSALKAYLSGQAAAGIEDCRKACGGHGYLLSSGLPELVNTFLMNPTVEGDNHMLPQQVIKVLLKVVAAVQKAGPKNDRAVAKLEAAYGPCDSRHLIPSLRAILRGDRIRCSVQSLKDWTELPVLLAALRHRAARLLSNVAVQMRTAVSAARKSPGQAWNDALIAMSRASAAYAQFLVLHNFLQAVPEQQEETADSENDTSAGATSGTILLGPAERRVLHDLARLLALYWIERDGTADFLQDGYASSEQAEWVRAAVLEQLRTVRPDAVSLADARDISDFCLKSTLGRYDGNCYQAIMETSRRDPLNEQEPGPGYEQHLKRLYVDGVGVYTGTASRL